MDIVLDPIEARVLACLVEKSLSTPEYYPLTLNALSAACSQKSNRDPILQLPDEAIVRALDSLREKKLAWSVTMAGSRMPRYRHSIQDVLPVSPQALGILCELMLRGPQTAAELRNRASRLFAFSNAEEVQAALGELTSWHGQPLAKVIPRRAGQREERYVHLLSGAPPEDPAPSGAEPARVTVMAENERLTALEVRVSTLQDELARLSAQFADFARQFQ